MFKRIAGWFLVFAGIYTLGLVTGRDFSFGSSLADVLAWFGLLAVILAGDYLYVSGIAQANYSEGYRDATIDWNRID